MSKSGGFMSPSMMGVGLSSGVNKNNNNAKLQLAIDEMDTSV